ncbi:hypothetical protein [Bradyrhizobium sp. UFLA05-112]
MRFELGIAVRRDETSVSGGRDSDEKLDRRDDNHCNAALSPPWEFVLFRFDDVVAQKLLVVVAHQAAFRAFTSSVAVSIIWR